ncbi:integral membrane protein [gut metagenome]|uniref:Integral membrane protein n=1 Tax=gut metagenome TaxID=749906 RepID=J9G5Q4_9ZZZZ
MYRVTLILLLSLLLPDIYLYLAYVTKRTSNYFWRILYWLPSVLLTFIYVYFIYFTGGNALAHHPEAIGHLAIAVMLLAVPKIVLMLASLLGISCRGIGRILSYSIRHTPFREPQSPFIIHRRYFTLTGLILGTISFFNILYGALVGVSRFEVKEITYSHKDLPHGFDGYRILQLSDIHIGSWHDKPKKIERMVNLANAQQADLIVFTGDLVNQQSYELQRFDTILNRLKATDGVYSVLGNHDYGTYYHWKNPQDEFLNCQYLQEMQKAMGWQLLNNEHVILHHRGDSIALIGVENDGEPPFPQHADLRQAMKGTEGLFSILLSHNPTHWRREVLPQSDIQLMLAGHTHAMQMELFGRSLSALKYPEWSGLYQEGEQALYVNVGIGYIGLPFRFGAWPEITVITLRSK